MAAFAAAVRKPGKYLQPTVECSFVVGVVEVEAVAPAAASEGGGYHQVEVGRSSADHIVGDEVGARAASDHWTMTAFAVAHEAGSSYRPANENNLSAVETPQVGGNKPADANNPFAAEPRDVVVAEVEPAEAGDNQKPANANNPLVAQPQDGVVVEVVPPEAGDNHKLANPNNPVAAVVEVEPPEAGDNHKPANPNNPVAAELQDAPVVGVEHPEDNHMHANANNPVAAEPQNAVVVEIETREVGDDHHDNPAADNYSAPNAVGGTGAVTAPWSSSRAAVGTDRPAASAYSASGFDLGDGGVAPQVGL